jgi:hypothetical protein
MKDLPLNSAMGRLYCCFFIGKHNLRDTPKTKKYNKAIIAATEKGSKGIEGFTVDRGYGCITFKNSKRRVIFHRNN